jgi:2-hydroxychromene-2-carboxylate isomerase
MSNHIDFYFDIISPYAYIAHKKILKYKNIVFNYKPIYLGGLHKLAGIESPAFNKYKLRNNINDCNLVSEKNNIEFKWNSNFPINSLNIMRGYLCINEDKKNEYLNTFFDAYWKDNQDLSEPKNINKLLNNLKIDNDEFYNAILEQNIKNKLIKLTTDAFEKEVFGTPTFIINNKIFWGQDRLEYALEELKN